MTEHAAATSRRLPRGPGATRPRRRGSAPTSPRGRRAFTILELEVSLVVLMGGLLCMSSLVTVQGKQMTRAEAWCRDAPTYYLVSQSNHWLRMLGASANLETEAGQAAWVPPVTGSHTYDPNVVSIHENLDAETMTVRVELFLIE